MTALKLLKIGLILLITGCVYQDPDNYPFNGIQMVDYDAAMPYYSYDSVFRFNGITQDVSDWDPQEKVEGRNNSIYANTLNPVSHKTIDHHWVKNQPSNQYTIEIIQAKNPAEVARFLHALPKSQKTAQLKSSQNGYFVGLYGSYANIDQAQAALTNLPIAIKDRAKIITWANVQNKL